MKRVIQAGTKPVTSLSLKREWQRDGALREGVVDIMAPSRPSPRFPEGGQECATTSRLRMKFAAGAWFAP